MFRFTVRDVPWFTVLAAMGMGWWLTASDNAKLRKDNATLREDNDHKIWMGRYVQLQDSYWHWATYGSWATGALQEKGYAIERDGRFWKIFPPLPDQRRPPNPENPMIDDSHSL